MMMEIDLKNENEIEFDSILDTATCLPCVLFKTSALNNELTLVHYTSHY